MKPTANKEKWVTFFLASCMFLSSLGTSIANIALPRLSESFSAKFSEIQWVIISYILANTVFVISAGKIGDIFGRQKILRLGILLFAISAFFCGLSHSLWMLLVGRVFQGIASAFLMSLSLALVSELISRQRLGRTMGLLGTASAVGTASGPSLGGFILSVFGWPFIFFFVGIAAVIIFLASGTILTSEEKVRDLECKNFDVVGALLLGLTLLFYSLAVAKNDNYLSEFKIYLVLFLLLFGSGFYFYEKNIATPLISFSNFKREGLRSSFFMNVCVSTVMMSTLVVGPFYLSQTMHLSSFLVGAVMTIGPLASIISGFPAGKAVDRIGPSKVILMGLGLMITGALMFSFLPSQFGLTGYLISAATLSPGYQMFQAGNNSSVMSGVPDDQRGVTSGMLSLSRNLGLISGATAMGMIFSSFGMEMTFLTAGMIALLAFGVAAGRLFLSRRFVCFE